MDLVVADLRLAEWEAAVVRVNTVLHQRLLVHMGEKCCLTMTAVDGHSPTDSVAQAGLGDPKLSLMVSLPARTSSRAPAMASGAHRPVSA